MKNDDKLVSDEIRNRMTQVVMLFQEKWNYLLKEDMYVQNKIFMFNK